MWGIERVGRLLCVAAVGVAIGCGSDGDVDPAVTDPQVTVTEPTSSGSGPDTESAGLTIEGLCDPLDVLASVWVGGDVERGHSDLFAADEPASLICEWQGSPEYREIRVVYHASPSVWDATVASGGAAVATVGADNLYDGEILSVHADNGWTIDVMAFEGDPPDHVDAPDVLAPIATAALEATR